MLFRLSSSLTMGMFNKKVLQAVHTLQSGKLWPFYINTIGYWSIINQLMERERLGRVKWTIIFQMTQAYEHPHCLASKVTFILRKFVNTLQTFCNKYIECWWTDIYKHWQTDLRCWQIDFICIDRLIVGKLTY